MGDITSKALALLRPTLKGHPQLVQALPLQSALKYKVLLLSITGRNELEAAVADDLGHRFLQALVQQSDFQRDLGRAARKTPVEVGRLAIKAKVHPPDVILQAIERSYPAEMEIRVAPDIAAVISRDEAERMGVLLESVKGTIVYSLCIDGNGERFLRERFQQKTFREAVALSAGLDRETAKALTLFKPRRVAREVFTAELDKAYLETRGEDLSDKTIRTQVRQVRKEHEFALTVQTPRTIRVETTGVLDILQTILSQAYLHKASDVEIWYELESRTLRYRLYLDTGWKPRKGYPIDLEVYISILNSLKIKAGIREFENNDQAFDGRASFEFQHNGRQIQFDGRVNVLPRVDTKNRKKKMAGATIRIFHGTEEIRPLDQLGLHPFQLEIIHDIAQTSDGLLLVGGPTNSGKNGTLKSVSSLIHQLFPEKKFCSIEDPVEVGVPFMWQTEVGPQAKPEDYLPALLRSNPQVIQMAEIRDEQSARFAFMAADTGIFTQSTVHIRNPFQVVGRLGKLGVSSLEVAETVCAVIYQRLLPKLCRECAVEENLTEFYERYPRFKSIMSYWQVNPATFFPLRANKVGCSKCLGGYAGRIGVFEIWIPGPQKFQLSRGEHMHLVRETAIQHFGHWTLLRAALCHALTHAVDLESVMSVTNGVDPAYECVEGYRYQDVRQKARDMNREAKGETDREADKLEYVEGALIDDDSVLNDEGEVE